MDNKHNHEHCKHEGHLHYCEHCDVVWCDACGQEYPEKVTTYIYTGTSGLTYPYPYADKPTEPYKVTFTTDHTLHTP